jgi:PAS domain-containing protein
MAIYPRNDKPWMFGLHQCSHARVWTDGEIRLFRQVGARLADGLNLYLLNQTLRASEIRYRSVVEDLTEFVIRWHPSGRRTFVNEAFCRFLNQSADALLGREALGTVDTQTARYNKADVAPRAVCREHRQDSNTNVMGRLAPRMGLLHPKPSQTCGAD